MFREYHDEVMLCPTSPENWKAVEVYFKERWNTFHDIVAIEGSHSGTVVTHSAPSSEVSCLMLGPYVGNLVVAYRWLADNSTEP